ncbi:MULTISPECIES: electron transport complex subunit RsxD [Colwellia]|uniref:Ion-translocating oxidoreductase complex subunit D n=1 Tax=Colwellia psychrerythraea (strain 34H / ATCC BAA-681) TaxID=167879 RepID=RNFD_COLP3|nr:MULTISPECIES: electron transport complex subunit RsxD [Colwellia]Q482U6.1 RecName: Full=Ion-translocating oxidoreductase complex subunit D; AltName: Full=Rnf electron transport complex subunit D [Colwellia psychrerythraea 34H]AAZ24953.1 electron transport complex, RnfABCDGE type, D subunit [Colwellia psychrerythraea 34H]PKH87895.1 electron transport complex subunit D [Colwellia sp. Bg11-28]
MAFWIASSPHNHNHTKTPNLMRLVIYATLPGVLAQWYFFGWGNLIHIGLAMTTAIICEFTVLSLRKKPISHELFDGSALLTALLLGICLPALAPWWITVIGTMFAIVIVKQLYGGLGHNPFNPAMAGYVMLLVSFPLQMTLWQPPLTLVAVDLNFTNTLTTILTGFTVEGYSVEQVRTSIDGITMATPLDTLKTNTGLGLTVLESIKNPIFGENLALGWEWVNAGFLLGGLFLISRKAIAWQTPISFLLSLFICSFIGYSISPDSSASTMFHWFSGATMLGAFFILTDPVTGATSNKGRIIVGLLAGLLVYLIRTSGGYPDGVAFAILLCNMSAPLIDQYTRPRTYGHLKGDK